MKGRILTGRRENPRLYEIDTAQWLSEISKKNGKRSTLGTVPDEEWDRLLAPGFDYVWLMGVWKRSIAGLRIFRQGPEWPPFREYLDAALPGWKDADVAGSPYSIAAYEPDPMIGTWEELQTVRAGLNKRGTGLILDFVPNHTAPDHPWVSEHPDYYFMADRAGYEKNPSFYSRINGADGETRYIARGKDPNFPAWSDTAQLNYFNPALRKAMLSELRKIAGYSDGIRCDMAMLVINDIFARNWRSFFSADETATMEFWEQARAAAPGSILMAEAYWNTEWRLMEMGFDYMYDKTLYDRLRFSSAQETNLHLAADTGYQKKLVRFLENHDEPRSLPAFGPWRLRAAAVLFSTLPGMKLFYHGQLEGKKIRIPVQIAGYVLPEEPEKDVQAFYAKLLSITGQDVFHEGQWRLKDVFPFAEGGHQNLVAYTWKSPGRLKLVVVNMDPGRSQGKVPLTELDGLKDYIFLDELNGREYERNGAEITNAGLHVILDGYQAHIFDITPRQAAKTKTETKIK